VRGVRDWENEEGGRRGERREGDHIVGSVKDARNAGGSAYGIEESGGRRIPRLVGGADEETRGG
jgi:hypothetical protein